MLRISVVIATYNRTELLVRLLGDLAKQTIAPDEFEVVVIDDGSRIDPAPTVRALELPYALALHRQINQGQAVARHQGATLARAPIVLFLDDDMHAPPRLLAEHLHVHDTTKNAAVLGRIREDETAQLVIFERMHARLLERFIDDVRAGRTTIRGTNVYTGNFSLPRETYLRVGGFDASLKRSEDAELGIRLEKDGATFVLADNAYTIHSSDHASVESWLSRAHLYGIFDSRIGRKHSDVPAASPWRYVRALGRVGKPIMAFGITLPNVARRASRWIMKGALACDVAGFETIALAGSKIAFATEYARGIRDEAGGASRSLGEFLRWVERAGASPVERVFVAGMHCKDAIAEDHAVMRHYQNKYGSLEQSDIKSDAVRKIGFQIAVAIRAMKFFSEAGASTLAQVTSRMIRLVYGSDIHWDADIAPGIMIVHGMGLCISKYARIGRGVILFQHVTLGDGTHPETRRTGGPHVEDDVHVGANAIILGPIRIGARSKIMATSVVRTNVPPDSLVRVPDPIVELRAQRRMGVVGKAPWSDKTETGT